MMRLLQSWNRGTHNHSPGWITTVFYKVRKRYSCVSDLRRSSGLCRFDLHTSDLRVSGLFASSLSVGLVVFSVWLLTFGWFHNAFANDHWQALRLHNGLAHTAFEPVIILAPGAQYDLSENEALGGWCSSDV
jgi:hypothetical protein